MTGLKLITSPDRVTLSVGEGDQKTDITLLALDAAQIGFGLLHAAQDASTQAEPAATADPDELQVLAHPIQIPSIGTSDGGRFALGCVAPGGHQFHLTIDSATARSLCQMLLANLPHEDDGQSVPN